MDKKQIGEYVQMAGYGLGTVSVILLVLKLPIVLILATIGAGLYFIGSWLKKS